MMYISKIYLYIHNCEANSNPNYCQMQPETIQYLHLHRAPPPTNIQTFLCFLGKKKVNIKVFFLGKLVVQFYNSTGNIAQACVLLRKYCCYRFDYNVYCELGLIH